MTATETATLDTRSRPKGSSGLPPALAEELKAMLGQRFSTAQAVRDQHGVGESYPRRRTDAVCFAESTEDVAIVKACARHKTPIIPFGGGFAGDMSARRMAA